MPEIDIEEGILYFLKEFAFFSSVGRILPDCTHLVYHKESQIKHDVWDGKWDGKPITDLKEMTKDFSSTIQN